MDNRCRGAGTPRLSSTTEKEPIMNRTNFNEYLGQYQAKLLKMVISMTFFLYVFSAYLTASFWGTFSSDLSSKLTLMMLACFLELSKVCSGLSLVYGILAKNMKIATVSFIALVILTANSGLSSIATISLKLGDESKLINTDSFEHKATTKKIKDQNNIINSLLLSQETDIKNGYRARAGETLLKIKQEQLILDDLELRLKQINTKDFSVSKVSKSIEELMNVSSTKVEHIFSIFLGALAEIVNIFLLLTWCLLLKMTTLLKYDSHNKSQGLPISKKEYDRLTGLICSGEIKPTQRAVKQIVNLGNEKIAEIFHFWEKDNFLQRKGRRYILAV